MAGDDGVLSIRKAVIRDADTIQKMVNRLAGQGAMLAIALSDVFEHIRDFWVVEKGGEVVGTCALHVIWEDLGEVRSLAVDPCCRDLGVGRALVEKCLEEAAGLHLGRVFALTYQEEFFRHMGFDVKLKPYIQRSDGSAKGDWDVGITIDVMSLATDVDTVILLSGDGDFALLLEKIHQDHSVRTEVYGVQALTAQALIKEASVYHPIKEDLLV